MSRCCIYAVGMSASTPQTWSVVQGRGAVAQRPQAEELAGLYDEYAVLLYRYALGLVGAADAAQDVVQEVFLGLLRHGELRRIRNMRSYLLRAARNQALMQLRRARRECPLDGPWIDATGLGPDEAGLAADLEAALRGLPAEQREAVILKAVGGLSFREIGEVVAVSQNTVATRYRTALRRLRSALTGGEDGQASRSRRHP